jgi:hypothetical protein
VRAWQRYSDAHGSVLAGGVGYFAFFSIFPAAALAFTVFDNPDAEASSPSRLPAPGLMTLLLRVLSGVEVPCAGSSRGGAAHR